jgi:hypothetical protein
MGKTIAKAASRTVSATVAEPSGRDSMKHSDIHAAGSGASEAERNAIEQVRELLFGEARRTADQKLDDVNARFDLFAAEVRTRFDKIEASVDALTRDSEQRRLHGIESIGSAIADLGAHIRKLGAARNGA